MGKAPDAFRTISEVAEWLDVAPHVLRFWESKFTQVKPVKRAGGRRYYRPDDMALLGGIKVLLHDEGQTIKAVQAMIRNDGIPAVVAHAPAIDGSDDMDDATSQTDNVVAFEPTPPEAELVDVTPAPETKSDPAPAPEAEHAPEIAAAPAAADPQPDTPPAADAATIAPPPAKPRIIDTPPIPDDTPDYAAMAPSALALTLGASAAQRRAKADEIAPLVARLRTLRDQMTQHGARR